MPPSERFGKFVTLSVYSCTGGAIFMRFIIMRMFMIDAWVGVRIITGPQLSGGDQEPGLCPCSNDEADTSTVSNEPFRRDQEIF